ncbi:MAG: hypothetical protein IPN42_08445 [Methylococcaceae bacterium]|nr:hypothetical protein [Methylococcaceae bacterium]
MNHTDTENIQRQIGAINAFNVQLTELLALQNTLIKTVMEAQRAAPVASTTPAVFAKSYQEQEAPNAGYYMWENIGEGG